jgi:Planctomycete cytochrome C
MKRVSFLVAAALAAALSIASCTSSSAPAPLACVSGLALDCKPLYDPPIYQTIFDKTLHPTCATGSGTCHTSDGAKGGLVFENADAAYALLLGTTDGRKRVVAGDAACSLVMIRLSSTDPTVHMPPGSTFLPDAERCAIAQWIAAGAKR